MSDDLKGWSIDPGSEAVGTAASGQWTIDPGSEEVASQPKAPLQLPDWLKPQSSIIKNEPPVQPSTFTNQQLNQIGAYQTPAKQPPPQPIATPNSIIKKPPPQYNVTPLALPPRPQQSAPVPEQYDASLELPPELPSRPPVGQPQSSVIQLYQPPKPEQPLPPVKKYNPVLELPPQAQPSQAQPAPPKQYNVTPLVAQRRPEQAPIPIKQYNPSLELPPEHAPQAVKALNSGSHFVEVSKAPLQLPEWLNAQPAPEKLGQPTSNQVNLLGAAQPQRPQPQEMQALPEWLRPPQASLSTDQVKRLGEYQPHRITVSIPDKKVIVQDTNTGKVLKTYSAFLGTKDNPTPEGKFNIITDLKPDLKGSEWYYGGHFMPFLNRRTGPHEISEYGFHGWTYTKDDDETEKEEPGWKTSTHGCVQLANKDMADFANLVRSGDPVTIVNEPWSIH